MWLDNFYKNCVHFASAGCNGTAEILAKDSQSKRSHVFKWTRRNFRCYWTIWICKSNGASLQTASQMCVQSTLSGLYFLNVQSDENFYIVNLVLFAAAVYHT